MRVYTAVIMPSIFPAVIKVAVT